MGVGAVATLGLIVCLVGLVASDDLFHLYTIPNAVQRNALCNDGTDYGFYFRKGENQDWVIRLQGGGWCWDYESCQSRWKYSQYWMTSKGLPQTMTDQDCIGPACHAGILSSNKVLNPYFYNANQVYVWYCTSDSHLGTQPPQKNGNWSFFGKHVIQAIMEEVVNNRSFNFHSAQNVLITGDSAGGVATLNNINWMISYLSTYSGSKTIYKGFVDAGWFLDFPTFQNRNTAFRNISRGLLDYAKVVYDVECQNFYKASNETWKCFHAQYVHRFIKHDLFYNEFGFDSANLGFDGLPGPPYSGSMEQYVVSWRKEFVETQEQIKNLFTASCFLHETEDTTLFYAVTVDRVRLANAVGQWFYQHKTHRYMDSCNTINCNPTC